MTALFFLMGAACCISSRPLNAQVPAIGSRPGQRQIFCDFGRPKPDCDIFPIADLGYNLNVSGESRVPYVDFQVGAARNITTKIGVGLSAALGLGDGYVVTARPRLKVWLSQTLALDVVPGIVLGHDSGPFPSFSNQVVLNYRDRISIVIQHDLLKREAVSVDGLGKYESGLFGGVRIGLGGYVIRALRGSSKTECRPAPGGRRCPGT